MNNLNSILIEGTIYDSPVIGEDGKVSIILSVQRYKNKTDEEANRGVERCFFPVQFAEKAVVVKFLEVNRRIRVVGRLYQEETERGLETRIYAEHIELKRKSW